MTQQILIQYDNSEGGMYGEAEGIDLSASEQLFEKKLEKALSAEFPGAEIKIETGYGRYIVDGNQDTDTDEVERVVEVLGKVWEKFDWVVRNS